MCTSCLYRGTSYMLLSHLIRQLNYTLAHWLFALISSIAQILPYHSPVTIQYSYCLARFRFIKAIIKRFQITLVSDSHKTCLCHCSYKASSDLERHRCWVNPLSPCLTPNNSEPIPACSSKTGLFSCLLRDQQCTCVTHSCIQLD